MKPFKTLEEQIEILRQRNLEFKEEKRAKRYLLDYNYYNIINYYSKFFMDIKANKYYEGVYFEDILEVHHFDKEIKHSVFKAIMEIERHFKSILAYNYTKIFKDNLYSYLDINNYESNLILDVANTTSLFSKKISLKSREKNNNSIKHYINNHNSVPFWILVDHLTFGEVIKFYKLNKEKIRNAVVKDLIYFLEDNTKEKSKTQISSKNINLILENILELRNVTAHNNILLGLKLRNDLPYLDDIHSKLNINKTDNRQSFYHSILYFQLFLTKNQYEQLENGLKKRIKKLKNKINEAYYNEIVSSLGFPLEYLNSINKK